MMKKITEGHVHKISECVYPWAVELIERYQKNYKGKDKMTRKFMLDQIEKFKK